MSTAIVPAPWLQRLPQDSRGYLIPAETPWRNGVAQLSKIGTEWKVALAAVRCCAVCGFKLAPGQIVYRAFAQGDAADIRLHEHELAPDLGGPAHLSCMLYSAMVCPYLKAPTARLGKDSIINPGSPRGKLAAIMGFADVALMMYQRPHTFLAMDAPQPQFGYRRLIDDIRYRLGSELDDRYRGAIAEDSKYIDPSGKQSFWHESDPELKRLLKAAHKTMQSRRPTFGINLYGQPYGGYLLPLVSS